MLDVHDKRSDDSFPDYYLTVAAGDGVNELRENARTSFIMRVADEARISSIRQLWRFLAFVEHPFDRVRRAHVYAELRVRYRFIGRQRGCESL